MSGIGKKLPAGWGWKRLGDICIEDKVIIDGRNSTLPFIGMEMIKSGTGEIDLEAQTMPGVSTCYYFDERHILYGKLRPYLNKVALPNFSGRCSTELVPLFPINGNCRGFLAYLLRRNETIEYIMKEKTGSRMPRANMKYLLSMKIPIPPIEEQERIVKIIENKLTAVDKVGIINTEQLINCDLLKDKLYGKIFDEYKNWNNVSLNNVANISAGGDKPNIFSESKTINNPIPVIANAIKNDGIVGYTNKFIIEKNSITVSARGTIGYSSIRNYPYYPIVRLISIIPNENIIDINYLKFIFDILYEKGVGTSIPQLTIPMIVNKQIPLPP